MYAYDEDECNTINAETEQEEFDLALNGLSEEDLVY